MGWSVDLSGDPNDLATLAKATAFLAEQGWTITTVANRYFLASAEFDAINDAARIRSRASELLALWNGAARLQFDCGNIGIASVRFRSSSGRQTVSLTYRFHVRAAASAKGCDAAAECIKHATNDPAIKRVLELASNGLSDWVNLYRVYEVIADDCHGLDAIASRRWATKADMDLFRRTANHPAVLRVDARHGVSKNEPPSKPMSLPDASALIRGIVQSWLKAKLAGAS